ncbi:pyridoxal phosphate-dependent decarboxylase family protein [uncultured Jatrophihabitans sp.]|uniref:pyridoxal phosphate-dependent decarboxylase family protein n=1 Tax=uncultured Jatrophihabitans sp. TaxID=1610747 RepID=UPI0035C970B2
MNDRVPTLESLRTAHRHADDWITSLDTRDVPARATAEQMMSALGTRLPDEPTDPAEVVDLLATRGGPGLVASPSGRFFGMVVGGTHPAALGADWLVSAWDQNAGLGVLAPTATAAEQLAGSWLLELLGLPSDAAVGFPTGATMSNWSCLAAARDAVLRTAGWDVAQRGLTGGPRVRVLAGTEVHESVLFALSYLGLGEPRRVAADAQGRIDPVALAAALDPGVPTIVVLQAGNVHSGAFDPFPEAIAAARRVGAWVHVDGAFGLFAACSPALRQLTAGMELADSWTSDAHKTLNVPYDCGITIVRDAAALNNALGKHGAYLIRGAGDPTDRTPEFSRRARGVPVWAVLRSLGRQGCAELLDRLHANAAAFAAAAGELPGVRVLNDVVYTQVCLSLGSDDRTAEVGRRLMADGTTWISGSRWRGQAVLRVSVSNWSTGPDDVRRSLEALRAVIADVDVETQRRPAGRS